MARSKKNTGKPFEKLTTKVITDLARIQGLINSTFQPDILLDAITCRDDGTPFQHQIDLCWDFELEGKACRTIFQAKDWSYRVDFPTLMSFCGVLTDLPGEPYGVIVTRTGFDGGVLEYAKARGIGLYILDELGDADFVSCIPSVEIKIDQTQDAYGLRQLLTFHPTNTDGTYIESDPNRAADAAVALLTRPTDQIALFSATGPKGTMSSFLHYVHGEAQKDGLTEYPASIFHELKGEPLFIGTDDPQYRFVQIGAVWIELQKLPIAETIVINSTLTHILQFCAELEDYYVDNDFQIHKAGENFTKVIELELGPEGQKIPFVIGFSIPIRSIKRARKPEKRRRKNA